MLYIYLINIGLGKVQSNILCVLMVILLFFASVFVSDKICKKSYCVHEEQKDYKIVKFNLILSIVMILLSIGMLFGGLLIINPQFYPLFLFVSVSFIMIFGALEVKIARGLLDKE